MLLELDFSVADVFVIAFVCLNLMLKYTNELTSNIE